VSLAAADAITGVLPPLTNACGAQPGLLCRQVLETTHSQYLASSAELFLAKPLKVLLILLVAVLVRRVINRALRRVVTNAAEGQLSRFGGTRTRPTHRLWDVVDAPVAVRERRRQRAETVGTLLRSATTFIVFGIALVTILGELGINLTPIVASAGIVGVAVGFGAQNLVRDFLTGIFMILEDQYGVGDVIDVGPPNASNPISGTVEAVGLRITTIRDGAGVVWYVRNGEIVRVGNKSQGWAVVNIDVPVGFVSVEQATAVLQEAAEQFAVDPAYADDFMDPPKVLGVEQLTADGAVLRTTVKTSNEAQWRIGRELRRRLTEALERAGIAAQLTAARMYIRPANGEGGEPAAGGPGGPGGPTGLSAGPGGSA
jgi:small conductance mechanosensitive channel